MANKKNKVDVKLPTKCKSCDCRKVVAVSAVPYNFCSKLNASFCGYEPIKFFNCGKLND